MGRHIAIVGAGINGVCTAIALAEEGFIVTVYERAMPFGETSSRSSRMLHGGIRYLETGQFKLVREALKDRAWWVKNVRSHTKINRFFIPVYTGMQRGRLKLYIGAKLYQILAGKFSFGPSQYHNKSETLKNNKFLSRNGLVGSVSYVDVQMDDSAVSNWLLEKAESLGCNIVTHSKVARITEDGTLFLNDGGAVRYDAIVNACGPWAVDILDKSGVQTQFELALIKGSHIIIDRAIDNPIVIQVKNENRVVFAMPVSEGTLVGTTEIECMLDQEIICSKEEVDYLLNALNQVFSSPVTVLNIISSYAGMRPIIRTKSGKLNLGQASRGSSVEVSNKLLNIFGGKWTSGMRLGKYVSSKILNIEH